MKKIFLCILVLFMITGCNSNETIIDEIDNDDVYTIVLNENTASIDNKKLNEYDYVWHISKDKEDEYYTGNKPADDDLVYIAHDIIYYPEINESEFTKQKYDDEIEWVTYYTSEELKDYIFSTLPALSNEFPKEMMHSEEEAYNNPVLHINKEGTYILQGTWNGQILIDLGKDSFSDESKKVELILDGVDVKCDVASAIMFKNAYEVDNTWEEKEVYSNDIDLTNAGAKITINDGTINNIEGSNVYRILKPIYKDDTNTVQKKRYKYDGALYSCMSLLIEGQSNGSGILNITSSTFEGLNSELHLTINSGYINIVSQDDGININEDDVSVFTMNDG